jgi:hypothetical protein
MLRLVFRHVFRISAPCFSRPRCSSFASACSSASHHTLKLLNTCTDQKKQAEDLLWTECKKVLGW